MTMLDDRGGSAPNAQPGGADFGNWQKAATIGLFAPATLKVTLDGDTPARGNLDRFLPPRRWP